MAETVIASRHNAAPSTAAIRLRRIRDLPIPYSTAVRATAKTIIRQNKNTGFPPRAQVYSRHICIANFHFNNAKYISSIILAMLDIVTADNPAML